MGGLVSVVDVQSLLFLLKICTMTRHHASNVLLARNLAFDSDVRQ